MHTHEGIYYSASWSSFSLSRLGAFDVLCPLCLRDAPSSKMGDQVSPPFASARDRLAAYFPEDNAIPIDSRKPYNDVDIQHISSLLQHSHNAWTKFPRTYIVLRTIGQLNLLNDLIAVGFTDHWFPVKAMGLPQSLSPSI